jgi:predicted adenylyl cyclase CyaB
MSINLELKTEVKSEQDLENKIQLMGAKYIETLKQKDIYYLNPDSLLKLRIQNGTYQLIKYLRNETVGDRWSDYEILNLSGSNVEEFLNSIFKTEVSVNKQRKLYIFKHTRIHLDNVLDLGKFLELETVVEDISKQEAISEFNDVVNSLNLDLNRQIKKSYRDLLRI